MDAVFRNPPQSPQFADGHNILCDMASLQKERYEKIEKRMDKFEKALPIRWYPPTRRSSAVASTRQPGAKEQKVDTSRFTERLDQLEKMIEASGDSLHLLRGDMDPKMAAVSEQTQDLAADLDAIVIKVETAAREKAERRERKERYYTSERQKLQLLRERDAKTIADAQQTMSLSREAVEAEHAAVVLAIKRHDEKIKDILKSAAKHLRETCRSDFEVSMRKIRSQTNDDLASMQKHFRDDLRLKERQLRQMIDEVIWL